MNKLDSTAQQRTSDLKCQNFVLRTNVFLIGPQPSSKGNLLDFLAALVHNEHLARRRGSVDAKLRRRAARAETFETAREEAEKGYCHQDARAYGHQRGRQQNEGTFQRWLLLTFSKIICWLRNLWDDESNGNYSQRREENVEQGCFYGKPDFNLTWDIVFFGTAFLCIRFKREEGEHW